MTTRSDHDNKCFLAELKSSRVDSFDGSNDNYGAERRKAMHVKNMCKTDSDSSVLLRRRKPGQSLHGMGPSFESVENQPGDTNAGDDKNDLGEKRKFATLDPRHMSAMRGDAGAMARTNTEEQSNLCSGMLYKTSRGKITSNLTRGQHEHRQQRRFQLTEHSLEYSQLLQRVSDFYAYAKSHSYMHACYMIG